MNLDYEDLLLKVVPCPKLLRHDTAILLILIRYKIHVKIEKVEHRMTTQNLFEINSFVQEMSVSFCINYSGTKTFDSAQKNKQNTNVAIGPSSSSVVTCAIRARFLTNPQPSPSGVSQGQSIPHCNSIIDCKLLHMFIVIVLSDNQTKSNAYLARLQCSRSTNFHRLFKLWLNFCHEANSSNEGQSV